MHLAKTFDSSDFEFYGGNMEKYLKEISVGKYQIVLITLLGLIFAVSRHIMFMSSTIIAMKQQIFAKL